jgi:hypothetical protein
MKPFKKLDDEVHFWMGMIISFLAFFLCDFIFSIDEKVISIIITYIAPILAGLSKEFYDKYVKKTKFDWRDFKFTAIGGVLFPFLLTIIQVVYFYSKP